MRFYTGFNIWSIHLYVLDQQKISAFMSKQFISLKIKADMLIRRLFWILSTWFRKPEAAWGEPDMDLIGSTLTATYARPKTSHFLPAISTMASSYRNTQPALAMNPSANLWRTNNYYKSTAPSSIQRENFDLVRAKTMFYPSNRTALSTRYTPDDWYKSNQSNYRESESSRNSAERLRRDTIRLMQDREQVTRRTQENTSKNIGERLNDIVFWKSELSHEIDNMVTEIAALSEVKGRLERALAETAGPLQVRLEGICWNECMCVYVHVVAA